MSIAEAVLPEPLQKLIDDLTPDVADLVEPAGLLAGTTQNDYGYYMSMFSSLPPIPGLSPASSLMVWGLAFVKAGANEAGVKAAIRVMT